MTPVIVLWTDAYSGDDNWVHLNEYAPKPGKPNITVGYVVLNADDHLHIASTVDQDDINVCGIMVIPINMIIYISYLKPYPDVAMGTEKAYREFLKGDFAMKDEIVDFSPREETPDVIIKAD